MKQRRQILWDLLKNSSQETIDFPVKMIMKNFGKVPNHISILDEKVSSKKRKKNRKKSNSSKKNIGSAGTSKLMNPPKSKQVFSNISLTIGERKESQQI